MNADQAAALRKAFPKSAIGQLPKPYKAESPKGNCQECGGYHGLPAVHLDYVGHAATTDRLLAVDPEWSWRPFTTEEILALPPTLRDAGLWIHLTVCGVTRPGVGDGKSAKECIGDAIRNAAMRFGVALDLWAKEDLHDIQTDKNEPDVPERNFDDPPPDEPMAKAMTTRTRGAMFALFGELDIPEEQQLAGINRILGTDYSSRGHLTEDDAKKVVEVLRRKKKEAAA